MEEWIHALKNVSNNNYYQLTKDYQLRFLNGYHKWYVCSHARPTYCNVCREALSGVTSHGLSCEVCKFKTHKRCATKATNNCKWSTLASIAKDIIEDEDRNIKMPHQWLEGNLPVNAKCSFCEKPCGSVLRMQDFRCLWCKAYVHSHCKENYPKLCDLGICRVSILPPTHLNTLGSDGFLRASKAPNTSPLVVFVNSKSGDNQGVKFLRKFKQLLNPAQVFDLIDGGPVLGLRLFQKFDCFRVLVCGGDGSVGWVLKEIDSLNLHKQCQIGVLPLGTGNDLARVLGWGAVLDDDSQLPKLLESFERATTKMLDRWSILTYDDTSTLYATAASTTSTTATNNNNFRKLTSLSLIDANKTSHIDYLRHLEDSVYYHISNILQNENIQNLLESTRLLNEKICDIIYKSQCLFYSLANVNDRHFYMNNIEAKSVLLKKKLENFFKTLKFELKDTTTSNSASNNTSTTISLSNNTISIPTTSTSSAISNSHAVQNVNSTNQKSKSICESNTNITNNLSNSNIINGLENQPTKQSNGKNSCAINTGSTSTAAVISTLNEVKEELKVSKLYRSAESIIKCANSLKKMVRSLIQMVEIFDFTNGNQIASKNVNGCSKILDDDLNNEEDDDDVELDEEDEVDESFDETESSYQRSIIFTRNNPIKFNLNNNCQINCRHGAASALDKVIISEENSILLRETLTTDEMKTENETNAFDNNNCMNSSSLYLQSTKSIRPQTLLLNRMAVNDCMPDDETLVICSSLSGSSSESNSNNELNYRRYSNTQVKSNEIVFSCCEFEESIGLDHNRKIQSNDSYKNKQTNEKDSQSQPAPLACEEPSCLSTPSNTSKTSPQEHGVYNSSNYSFSEQQSQSSKYSNENDKTTSANMCKTNTTLINNINIKSSQKLLIPKLQNKHIENDSSDTAIFSLSFDSNGENERHTPKIKITNCHRASFDCNEVFHMHNVNDNKLINCSLLAYSSDKTVERDTLSSSFYNKNTNKSTNKIQEQQKNNNSLNPTFLSPIIRAGSNLQLSSSSSNNISMKNDNFLGLPPSPSGYSSSGSCISKTPLPSPRISKKYSKEVKNTFLLPHSSVHRGISSLSTPFRNRSRSKSSEKSSSPTSPSSPKFSYKYSTSSSTPFGFVGQALLFNTDALCAPIAAPMIVKEPVLDLYMEKAVMNNYFGIGLDAKISLEFHNRREEHPEKCKSRIRNHMWYGLLGSKELVQRTFKNLEQKVLLECDGARIPLKNVQGIVVLNIPSYTGGVNFWGNNSKDDGVFTTPSFDDKILEVVAVSGCMQMALSRVVNIKSNRIAQCRTVKIQILGHEGVPVQVDGEAWIQPPGFIQLIHKNRAQMLTRNKAFEQTLKTWSEKQKVDPITTYLGKDELSVLQSIVDSSITLIKRVKTASLRNPLIEQDLYGYANQASSNLDEICLSGKLLEKSLRQQITDFLNSIRTLHVESSLFLAEKATKNCIDNETIEKIQSALNELKSDMIKFNEYNSGFQFMVDMDNNEFETKPKSRFAIVQRYKKSKIKHKDDKELLKTLHGIPVDEWGPEEVSLWLQCLNLSEYKAAFIRHDIRGTEIRNLERRDLRELGIVKVGHIKRILNACRNIPRQVTREKQSV